jgi:hypothetical protein
MAKSHANKTMINHVRADGDDSIRIINLAAQTEPMSLKGSSFHVVEYNATTGAVIDRYTSQGYADNRYVPVYEHLRQSIVHLIFPFSKTNKY